MIRTTVQAGHCPYHRPPCAAPEKGEKGVPEFSGTPFDVIPLSIQRSDYMPT